MPDVLVLEAFQTPNLDTHPWRGSAPLSHLALISQADVFDQDSNPQGLQREMSRKHAVEAYQYAARNPDPEHPRAFPEVVLNVRDTSVLVDTEHGIAFDMAKLDPTSATVKVSRIDGNHRLLFAAGDDRERGPLDVMVPFQIHVGLTPEQEASLFLDINANQKGLNTSHLHSLRSRLTPEEVELELHPQRAYARRLVTDVASPWHDLVHMGGARAGAKDRGVRRPVNFVALESGVQRILAKSLYLRELESHDARYALIRAFWQAVRELMPEAWDRPSEYLVLKNIGVTAWSLFGATVIDRAMATGNVDADDMLALMKDARDAVDWHKDSPDVVGKSGNRAALFLAGQLAKALPKPRRGRKEATAA